ncbi:MAG: Nudix family hydrolase [Chromatiales bacterium]|nr:Nudix family hydrolase [Chromatiales bacterium]
MRGSRVEVAAGAIARADGRVLLARRHAHSHQGGLWEFPGGKLEPGETPAAALRRELFEELGIRAQALAPLIRLAHRYTDREIVLHVFRVLSFDGALEPREGQPIEWVAPAELHGFPMPAADRPIVAALRLQPLYAITASDKPGMLEREVEGLLARGYRQILLRAHAVNDADYSAVARRLVPACAERSATLVLHRAPEHLPQLEGCGLHLSAKGLFERAERPAGFWPIGASCHNVDELRRAELLGLDYGLLSPVQPTPSHPDRQPLGWDGFARLVEPVAMPVYALGGVGPADIRAALRHGAQGVAGIRGFSGVS